MYNQGQAGLLLLSSGVGLQFVGLCWGSRIHAAPFQRLAMSAHSNALSNGAMLVGTGLLLHTDIISLSPKQSTIVVFGLSTAWASVLSEIANSYWGTNQFLPIAAQNAGAHGAKPWQESVVAWSHIATIGMIPAFGIVGYELMLGTKGVLI